MVSKNSQTNKQQGSVLLVALMILIVLTLLTFSSSKSVLLQQKMTNSSKENILALEVAQAALKEGEESIFKLIDTDLVATGSSTGIYDGLGCGESGKEQHCTYMSALKDLYASNTWSKSKEASVEVSCGNPDDSCELKGRYIVIRLKEFSIGTANDNNLGMAIHSNVVEMNESDDTGSSSSGTMYLYKVIARGSGKNPNNTRIVVSYFAARSKLTSSST